MTDARQAAGRELLGRFRAKSIESVRELSGADRATMQEHSTTLRWFEEDSVSLGHVIQELAAVEQLVEGVIAQMASTRGSFVDPQSAHVVIACAQRHVMNYLGLTRAFVDHTDKRIIQRFGKNSAQHQDFKAACRQHFDKTFAYRFLYRLRNFAQHKQVPIGHVDLSAAAGSQPPDVVVRFELSFERNRLLEDDSDAWRGVLYDELERGPKLIPVLETLKNGALALTDLHLSIVDQYRDRAKAACAFYGHLAREVGDGWEPVIVRIRSLQPAVVNATFFFRRELVADLRAVVEGRE